MTTKRLIGFAQIAVASVCFGFLGVFGKWAYQQDISIGELLTYRFGLAAFLLWSFLLLFRPNWTKISKQQFFISAGLGILGYALFATLYFTAIKGVSISLAVLLLYTFPFWVSLISHFRGQKLARHEWILLAGALIGMILLLWGQINVSSFIYVVAGVGAALSYALYIVVSSRWQSQIYPLTSSLYVITFATLALGFYHRPDFSKLIEFSTQQGLIILGISIICTIIPMTLVLASLQRLKESETALLSMIEPITATLASAYLFQDFLMPRQWLGGFLILFCLTLKMFSR